tara:strand:+ start:3909 stop:4016 length:108 start_codon:yes stop_codon:yes gene_type:complete
MKALGEPGEFTSLDSSSYEFMNIMNGECMIQEVDL